MNQYKAEVISIGDEMTSGQRLDTNSRWISQQLCDLGIEVAFHSTVGDDLKDCVDVFAHAAQRADLIIMTGGLGPTADDLTREVLAEVTHCELEFHEPTLRHIRALYAKFRREMPERNRAQAYFPKGCQIIPNPEGTAPGIDLTWQATPDHQTRFFCLPGVPAEMYEMWSGYVSPQIQLLTGTDSLIHHHVMHCFGTGESSIEAMLGDLTQRGRDPIVGITASQATISLRISTRGSDPEVCHQKMQPTIEMIHERLGDLIYGARGQSLAEVVLEMLNSSSMSLSIADVGLGGAVAWSLFDAVHLDENVHERIHCLKGSISCTLNSTTLPELAQESQQQFQSDISVAIGPIQEVQGVPSYDVVLCVGQHVHQETFNYAGHSDFRHLRSVKQVLNMLRLYLLTRLPTNV